MPRVVSTDKHSTVVPEREPAAKPAPENCTIPNCPLTPRMQRAGSGLHPVHPEMLRALDLFMPHRHTEGVEAAPTKRAARAAVSKLPSGNTIEAVFTGAETCGISGKKLWSSIKRIRLADERRQIPYNKTLEWPEDTTAYAPYFRKMFGTARPSQALCLLHAAPNVASAQGRPVLLIHGAGDNASRCWSHFAAELDAKGVPTYAITLPHPHADPRESADLIAAAIEAIKQEYKTERGIDLDKVDVVTHSMGALPLLTYTANEKGVDWGIGKDGPTTIYRHDVGEHPILMGAPLAGEDIQHRWPIINMFASITEKAANPSAWSSFMGMDMSRQDLNGDKDDIFRGQAALARPQPHPLPMFQPALWPFAMLQPDALTTYWGGQGLVSKSPGIDAAAEHTGYFLERLAAQGVDPDLNLHVEAGTRHYLQNGVSTLLDSMLGEKVVDMLTFPVNATAAIMAPWVATQLKWLGFVSTDTERATAVVQGFLSGQFLPGECTGPSDGVIFVSSATAADLYTKRGAKVAEVRTVDLAHTDLPVASKTAAAELRALIAMDPIQNGHLEATAKAYEENDQVEYVLSILRPKAKKPA